MSIISFVALDQYTLCITLASFRNISINTLVYNVYYGFSFFHKHNQNYTFKHIEKVDQRLEFIQINNVLTESSRN